MINTCPKVSSLSAEAALSGKMVSAPMLSIHAISSTVTFAADTDIIIPSFRASLAAVTASLNNEMDCVTHLAELHALHRGRLHLPSVCLHTNTLHTML